MEITGNYILFILGLLLVVFNIYTTKEATQFPLYSTGKKILIIALIRLAPVIGLIIAYKLLHLNPSVSSTGGGDGTQFYPSGSINDDNASE
jgi:hypothetical protein